MEVIEKLILWILLSTVGGQVSGSSVILNGPSIGTADLKAIDGYVASGLPLFASTHGFILHSGERPVIVKVKDPNKVIRDGIEQPNPGYYLDLPAVIPEGFEGVASTSFLLGKPIPKPDFHAPSAGPVVSFEAPLKRQPIAMELNAQVQNARRAMNSAQIRARNPQHIAQPSVRVESTLNPIGRRGQALNQVRSGEGFKERTNPVVVQTSEFESGLPMNFRNPFYRNEMLASMLAAESLPAPGEELVNEWNTNKIQEGRVRDLLEGAGLI